MDASTVRKYFENPRVVSDYAAAAENVGLWESEKKVFFEYIPKDARVLELGCGAGRVSIGLSQAGYADITATDFSPAMVEAAAQLAATRAPDVKCAVCDATKIAFPDESFDAVIFAFNGLMQIPRRESRVAALREIGRVLRRGGVFAFTTHDRLTPEHAQYWSAEQKQWKCGAQNPVLDDFGDIFYAGDHGSVFIHSPTDGEVSEALAAAGFSEIFKKLRSRIAEEPPAVVDFSDDCVFRVVKKL